MQSVEAHCHQIDECNQRGGRMLSIIDLLDAGTVTPDLAGYLLVAIGRYRSFMVGARPGGAGKTTVMGALLNFVPADVELLAADGPRTLREGLDHSQPPRCYICHEIGSGPYYAYLWGKPLHDLMRLPACGHMVATNLHADTIDDAASQICGDNGVPENLFNSFGLMLFLAVRRSGNSVQRRIVAVHEARESGPPVMVYRRDGQDDHWTEPSTVVLPTERIVASERIRALRDSGVRTIQEVRQSLVTAAS